MEGKGQGAGWRVRVRVQVGGASEATMTAVPKAEKGERELSSGRRHSAAHAPG